MVQSVALKRPRGGVRGGCFKFRGLSLALVHGACASPVGPAATAAPAFPLHCLGAAGTAGKATPHGPSFEGTCRCSGGRWTDPQPQGTQRGRASCLRPGLCFAVVPTSTHGRLAEPLNRALGPQPLGTSQDQFTAP